MAEMIFVPRNRRGLYNVSLQIVRESNDYRVFIWGYRCQQDQNVIGGEFDMEHFQDLLGYHTHRKFPLYTPWFEIHCVEGNEIKFERNGENMSLGDLVNLLNRNSFRKADSYIPR